MGVSLTGPRPNGAGPATVRLLAGAVRRSASALLGSCRRLAARLGMAELRAPAATFLLVPLLLGPQASAAALRDLLAGLLLVLVIERAVPPLAPASRGSLRELPWTSAAAAVLALAAAVAHSAGLLVLVLLVAGCEWARAVRPATPLDAACLALGAALRVDAGALLLGGGRGALLPLLVGSGVALVSLGRVRGASAPTAGPARARHVARSISCCSRLSRWFPRSPSHGPPNSASSPTRPRPGSSWGGRSSRRRGSPSWPRPTGRGLLALAAWAGSQSLWPWRGSRARPWPCGSVAADELG